jgi:hypothetical protein
MNRFQMEAESLRAQLPYVAADKRRKLRERIDELEQLAKQEAYERPTQNPPPSR